MRRQPASQEHLLLIASREFLHRLFGRTAFDAQLRDQAGNDLSLCRLVQHAAAAQARQDRERDVVGHAHLGNDAVALAVLGAEANSRRDGVGSTLGSIVPPLQVHGAGLARGSTEQDLGSLGTSGSQQAGQADDFSSPHIQAHLADGAAGAQLSCFQHQVVRTSGIAVCRACLRRFVLDGARAVEPATEHGGHEVDAAHVAQRIAADRSAVTHDGGAIADFVDFVQLVADVHDRYAIRLELSDDVEQAVDFPSVERGGRLVHDDQPRREANRPSDGAHLLRGRAEFAERSAHIDLDIEFSQQLFRFDAHGLAIQQAPARERTPQADVLGDRTLGNQVDLLVDRADPLPLGVVRRTRIEGLSLEPDLACILAEVASEGLDQRRFASAVLSHQGMDLARADAQRCG